MQASTRVIVGLVIVLVASLSVNIVQTQGKDSQAAQPNPEQYQAVFMPNDQVYYGRLVVRDDGYELIDPYYSKAGSATTLVKLGTEAHKPEAKIYIDRGSGMYWENLRPEGNISQAIKQEEG